MSELDHSIAIYAMKNTTLAHIGTRGIRMPDGSPGLIIHASATMDADGAARLHPAHLLEKPFYTLGLNPLRRRAAHLARRCHAHGWPAASVYALALGSISAVTTPTQRAHIELVRGRSIREIVHWCLDNGLYGYFAWRNERRSHLELIKAGYKAYLLMCERDAAPSKSSMSPFNARELRE